MRRVRSVDAIVWTRALSEADTPWWLRVAVHPLAITLATLTAFLVWLLPTSREGAGYLAVRLAACGDQGQRWIAAVIEILGVRSVLSEPAVLLALALAVAVPSSLWVGWQLARWSERAVATRLVFRL